MNESESKNEKPKEERQFDPELLKKGLRRDRWQYKFLKECAEKGGKGIKEWNEWRLKNPNEEILLEGAELGGFYLKDVNLRKAHLEGAKLWGAHLERANLEIAHLEGANLERAHLIGAFPIGAHLEGAYLYVANLQGAKLLEANLENAKLQQTKLQSADFSRTIVDGSTMIWKCKINRHSKNRRGTNFTGVGLDNIRIDPGTKQLLEYNIRRMNWEEWYKKHPQLKLLVKTFWLMSDYGLRSWRIIVTFFGLAIAFAIVYWLCPTFVMVNQVVGDIRGFWHALYFSVVTMTTLGFGDIAANPDSWGGQTLLMLQVILGYVLLGALVTRFAVLFTAGGPAGKFADEKGEKR